MLQLVTSEEPVSSRPRGGGKEPVGSLVNLATKQELENSFESEEKVFLPSPSSL